MFLLAVGLWMQVQAAQPGPVRVQLTIQPETVTVGQHFIVTLKVHAPAALAPALTLPPEPDTSGIITSFAPMQRHDVAQPNGDVDATVVYSLSAWIPGHQPLDLGEIVVGQQHVKMPNDSFTVQSVLPIIDSRSTVKVKLKPKPLRQLLPEPPLYKRLLHNHPKSSYTGIVLTVLALAALITWLLWRRRRGVPEAAGPSSDWVEHEFRKVELMHLVERGETELHAILMTGVVRDYLIRKFSAVRASATTSELVSALRGESLIPAGRTLELFERVDLLKFAHDRIMAADAQSVGVESRAVIHEIVAREEAALAALEAARNAAVAEKANTTGKKPSGRRAA